MSGGDGTSSGKSTGNTLCSAQKDTLDTDSVNLPCIRRLDADVVNRIAAGEVVAKPANAVKELVENSLDAGAKSIVVTVKDGGMRLLQIQDDGHGIRVTDFPLLCERFTTSKLRHFEDLRSIASFGFRGEALASITHVARVSITSKTRDSPCAYKARFQDGKLVPGVGAGGNAKPQPCAGTNGTTITAEDLFYNMQTRRQALKNPNDLYRAVLDVVTRYAVHFGKDGISFTCRKQGQARPDLYTPQRGASVLGAIKVAFGQVLGRELLELNVSSEERREGGREGASGAPTSPSKDEERAVESGRERMEEGRGNAGVRSAQGEEGLSFKAHGYVSNANFNMKKGVFMLFINNRMVESTAIKRIMESVYAPILPTHTHPFLYLALDLPPAHVDVNVHPTKREVHFLREDELLSKLAAGLEALLRGANTSRTFYGKSLAHGLAPPTDLTQVIGAPGPPTLEQGDDRSTMIEDKDIEGRDGEGAVQAKRKERQALLPYKMIRTDASMRNLRSFLYTPEADDYHSQQQSQPSPQDENPDSQDAAQLSSPLAAEVDSRNHDKQEGDSGTEKKEEVPDVRDDGAVPLVVASSSTATVGEREGGREGGKDRHYRRRLPSFTETKCQYLSVRALLADIHDRVHQGMTAILKKHIFVGVVDDVFSLIQHDTKLLLVRHVELCKELFYQLAVRRFACMPRLSLASNPVPLRSALRVALDLPEMEWKEGYGSKDELAARASQVLVARAGMLDEYFRIGFDTAADEGHGALISLPDLLPSYTPSPAALPLFLLRLATEVDWEEEQPCFEGVATELGLFYSDLSVHYEEGVEEERGKAEERDEEEVVILGVEGGKGLRGESTKRVEKEMEKMEGETGPVPKKYEYLLQHVLFPAFRAVFLPPRELAGAEAQVVVQIAALEQLYRVFERC